TANGVDRVGPSLDQSPPRTLEQTGLRHVEPRQTQECRRGRGRQSLGPLAAPRTAPRRQIDLGSGSTKGGRPFHLPPRLDLDRGEGRREGEDGRGSRNMLLNTIESSVLRREGALEERWGRLRLAIR